MKKENTKKTSSKPKVSNKETNKKVVSNASKKSNVNLKNNEVIKQKENYKNKIVLVVVAIVILVIILFSLFGCENKNNVDKLQGKAQKEQVEDNNKEVADNDQNIEDEQESNDSRFYIVNTKSETQDIIISPNVWIEEDLETKKLNAAKSAVEKAEETLDKDDIIFAEDLVDDLEDSEYKDGLEERVENLIEAYNVAKLVERLEKLTYEATNKEEVLVAFKFRYDNDIINLVDNLKLENVKKDLQDRLKKLEPILDDNTAPVITNIEEGKYYNIKVVPNVIEENIRSIKLNDKDYTLGEKISDGIYTFVVIDMGFNETSVSFIVDTIKPKLTLIGDDNITLEYKTGVYEEKGVLYSDNIDGDKIILKPNRITKDEILVDSVDVNEVGTYKLTYVATDSALNTSEITRTVSVKDTILPTATAIACYKDEAYLVILSEISEQLVLDDNWIKEDDTFKKSFDVLPTSITITDINGNENDIAVILESNEPIIIESVISSDEYSKKYQFNIIDDSAIEIVKIASGNKNKEYFMHDGDELKEPYDYLICENGEYTIYAKDKIGNEGIKVIIVNDINLADITDDELKNAFLISDSKISYEDHKLVYTKNIKVNPANEFEIKEIKTFATTLEYDDVTTDSFKNDKVHGSNVITLSTNEFDLIDRVGGANDNYHYIYFVAQKGSGTNVVTREYVIKLVISPIKD